MTLTCTVSPLERMIASIVVQVWNITCSFEPHVGFRSCLCDQQSNYLAQVNVLMSIKLTKTTLSFQSYSVYLFTFNAYAFRLSSQLNVYDNICSSYIKKTVSK